MAIYIKEASGKLGVEEKIIALNIMLVIYQHDKRHFEALRDIRELLNDPEMRDHCEYLLLKQREVKQDFVDLLNKRKPSFLQAIFNLFCD